MNNKGNKRKNGMEQFYTIQTVADQLTQKVSKYFNEETRFLDPCAGAGAFPEALKKLGVAEERILCFDIDPKKDYVNKADFLQVNSLAIRDFTVITNPPFGRACSMSVSFFNKCAELGAKYIIFLIPASFDKPAISKRLNKYYHLVETVPVPSVSFYTSAGINEKGILNTEFQVWERKEVERESYVPKTNLIEFVKWTEVKKGAPYDFCIRTHGSRIGAVLDSITSLTRKDELGNDHPNFRTVAFIKAKDPAIKSVLSKIDYSEWLKKSSYVPSICPKIISMMLEREMSSKGKP
jgi:hypothetical protein